MRNTRSTTRPWTLGKNRTVTTGSYRNVVGPVDVENTRMRQPALTPAEFSLMAQGASSEAEALGASSRVIRREAERAFLTLIALAPDGQFLENNYILN